VLNAAQEAVLMAVDACRFERVLATPARVCVIDSGSPPFDADEVRKHAEVLRCDQYVRVEVDQESGAIHYELTQRGEDYATQVAARTF
jgi:hypothetical protein